MRTVLILDNETSILTVFSRILTIKGFRVFTAEDTVSCRSILNSENIDILITESRLPGEDIIGFVRTLREKENFDKLSVIFLSGFGTGETMKNAMSAGGDEFLYKPCKFDVIYRTIEKITGLRSKRREM